MSLSRRRLLRLASVLPAGLALDHLIAAQAGAVRAIAAQARPPAEGSSATRCAACGSGDHAMLDAACPARPRVPGARVR